MRVVAAACGPHVAGLVAHQQRRGVGELPPWGKNAYDDLKPVNARELLAEYEEVGVKRILVGLNDMEDDGAFKTLEDAAKGMGLI